MDVLSSAHTIVARANTLTHAAVPKAYLVELATFQQQPLLGTYEQGKLHLSDCGLIVADEWVRSALTRKVIELDAWALTPTSLQGIVFIRGDSINDQSRKDLWSGQKPWLLSSFIASFKAAAAKRINLRLNQLGQSVWQRNYNEMLIADLASLDHLRDRLRSAAR
jgi:putative transposase